MFIYHSNDRDGIQVTLNIETLDGCNYPQKLDS